MVGCICNWPVSVPVWGSPPVLSSLSVLRVRVPVQFRSHVQVADSVLWALTPVVNYPVYFIPFLNFVELANEGGLTALGERAALIQVSTFHLKLQGRAIFSSSQYSKGFFRNLRATFPQPLVCPVNLGPGSQARFQATYMQLATPCPGHQ